MTGKFAPPMCAQSEKDEIIIEFMKLLRDATADGNGKRVLGTKPLWKVDPSHKAAVFSHIARRERGEMCDPDSGAHPFVHAAWRLLAIAWQETHNSVDVWGLTNGPTPNAPHIDAVGTSGCKVAVETNTRKRSIIEKLVGVGNCGPGG